MSDPQKKLLADSIRAEAERRFKDPNKPGVIDTVEEYVGWIDAAAWLDGTEEDEE